MIRDFLIAIFHPFLNISRIVFNYFFNNSDRSKFWETGWNGCPKMHLHKQYFAASLLPDSEAYNNIPGYRNNNDLANIIQCMIHLTGMIFKDLPNDEIQFGSGFVQRIRKKKGHCPCGANAHHEDEEFAILTITTVNHVVSSKEVVQYATFILDFNDEDKPLEDRVKLRGLRLLDTDRDVSDKMDWCAVEFVTCNMGVVRNLEENLNTYERLQNVLYNRHKDDANKLVVIVGHPHGGPKKVSFGEISGDAVKETLKEIRDRQNWCRYNYNNVITCDGSSGSPIFIPGQPICGFGYWFGHPHNHAKALERTFLGSKSSIGVDHT